MFLENTITTYSVLLITSTRKSFEALGKLIEKTGKTISRWLNPSEKYYEKLFDLSRKLFKEARDLILIFDDTLIRKIYSQLMEGSGRFYDTQLFRRVMAYKLLVAMLTDGSHSIPLVATFLFSNE